MALFAKVVEKASFSAAAEMLGLSKSNVSQQISQLEESLGIKLLNRSTRSLSLTDEGRHYYERCRRIVEEAEAAETELAMTSKAEAGKVRITCPYNLGLNFIVPLLPQFRELYPSIEIDLILEDRVLNMIDEGIDLSFRAGWLADSGLYSVAIAPMAMIIVASTSYVAIHGPVNSLDDLRNHKWISITGIQHPDRITVQNDAGEKVTISPIETVIKVNSGYAARSLVLAGAGIGMLPDYACLASLARGELAVLCPAWRSKPGTLSAVFPSRHHMTMRARIFIDFIRQRLPASLRM